MSEDDPRITMYRARISLVYSVEFGDPRERNRMVRDWLSPEHSADSQVLMKPAA